MMTSLGPILLWVLAAVVISLVVGYFMGKNAAPHKERNNSEKDRAATLQALLELLGSVQDITSGVEDRSSEMRAVQGHVGDLRTSGELELVRQVLMDQISTVLESNQKLEDDLVYARCRMEQQAEELDRTRAEANTDTLSGVANRKAFDEKLLLLLGGLKRGGDPFVLVLCDMDHFKWVNDTHGHNAGDNVLREFGALLRRCVRDGDIVARYGGDEFAMLLPKIDLETGLKIAARLRGEVTKTNFGLDNRQTEGAVTLSVGVALAKSGDTPVTIVERADQALYASKRGGRNQVQFQPTQEQATPQRPVLVEPDAPVTVSYRYPTADEREALEAATHTIPPLPPTVDAPLPMTEPASM
ncbi:MAG: GGDEF domain-containing protein [Pirellulales bacterium]